MMHPFLCIYKYITFDTKVGLYTKNYICFIINSREKTDF